MAGRQPESASWYVAARSAAMGLWCAPTWNNMNVWRNDNVDSRAMMDSVEEPMTVLVVDDVADFRGYVARVLQILGYDVWQAEDGPSAMALCEAQGRPDLAVMDVSLPGLTGPQVAQHLKQRCGDMGVVFMSGYAAQYLRDQGILPDDALFLRKPFTLPDVAQALDQLVATLEPAARRTAEVGAFCSAAE